MTTLEIACNSYQSCLNAMNAGANRIELFENLADGGCTPSYGMIKKASQLSLPIYVMIRPRGGNFHYSNHEIDVMLEDIDVCKQFAVNGIVFGCLTASGEVDKVLNKKLLDAWNGLLLSTVQLTVAYIILKLQKIYATLALNVSLAVELLFT